ncbi:glycosyltransferase family 2 protein [Salinibacterium sp. dk2585]|uniref:glycosyltransferase family 2 protein n=1 Tax=unclassified Salinibacterium TaxID=2632331 RepID=UPI0011C24CC6|nr:MULTISPECIES: glycosyltransferase family A protein [unclassified Salinibacterium]QEE61040.1 glycosyltransferase family 2 protein [Salinibacterium sp. dk2585]TXK52982.1 glycosyltransferase family 2 protein [Salinibacterium sp. dk5596]
MPKRVRSPVVRRQGLKSVERESIWSALPFRCLVACRRVSWDESRRSAQCAGNGLGGTFGHVRASVVVPVFNPGPGLETLIESFDAQTLKPDEFEVILCDDGSDEATRRRLAEITATRANVRVLTLAHTGWPGTPRNHGIDAARGRYVFFSDQDDVMFERALEQLCDYADRHSSDVVIGKVVGIGRRIPRAIFRRDIPRATLGKDPILELLTPHKLFRMSFLREHNIRFPDGRVRLEDHLFVMQAYFSARTISVLATEPCYGWVKNQGSASSSRIDPATYFPHLERVLDLVEDKTAPGSLRDTLFRHWYRGKILKRLDGARMVAYPEVYREAFLDAVIPIARQRFGPGVEKGLAFPLRIRSRFLKEGRRAELLRLAEFEAGLECRAEVISARWTRGGTLTLEIRVRVLRDGQDALTFTPREVARVRPSSSMTRAAIWQPPPGVEQSALTERDLDASRDLRSDWVELRLLDSIERAEYLVPGRARVSSGLARATLDPIRVFSRRDTSSGGRLVASVRRAGWTFETPLRADPAVLADAAGSPFLAGHRCWLALHSDGTLELRRDVGGGQLREFVARAARRAARALRRVAR